MSTDNEGTLQVKSFDGISRYFASPNNPPNKLSKIQNLYSPNRGELAYLPGWTELVPASTLSQLGITDLRHAATLENGTPVYFYHATPVPVPDITGFGFTTNGTATSYSSTIWVTYTGGGEETEFSTASATVTFGSGGVAVTLPTIPAGVASVNFFAGASTGAFTTTPIWIGSLIRDGLTAWPTTYNINNIGAKSANTTNRDAPTQWNFVPNNSGTIPAGTTLFFGIAPYSVGGDSTLYQPQITTKLNGTSVAYTIPQGYSGVTVYPSGMSGTFDGTNTYTYVVFMVGTTETDLLPVGISSATDIQPFPLNYISYQNYGVTVSVNRLPFNSNMSPIPLNVFSGNTLHCSLCIRTDRDKASTNNTILSAFVYDTGFTPNIRQLFPTRNLVGDFSQSTNQYARFALLSRDIETARLAGRCFIVNGVQSPLYTNGYVLRPMWSEYQTAPAPITTSVIAFQNRLVMGGGATNSQNTKDLVYYTELTSSGLPSPFSFTKTPGTSPTRNFAAVLSQGSIVGFGISSYSQTTASTPQAQLVCGKDDSIWVAADVTQGFQQTEKAIGFKSRRCFTNTNVGPMFLGQDNIYSMDSSGRCMPVGNDVASIVSAMSTTAGKRPHVAFHAGHVKIYWSDGTYFDPSTGIEGYNNALWCDVQLDDRGNRQMRWTGEHTLEKFISFVVPIDTKSARAAISGTAILALDSTVLTSANGADAQRVIRFNDLTLNSDHFVKILKRLYLSARINMTHTITITFSMVDESGAGIGGDGVPMSVTEGISLSVTGVGNFYKLFQRVFSQRYRGRVIKDLALTWNAGAASETIRIYDLSILFEPTRRRAL